MDNKTNTENEETLYKFDDELREEVTWNKICEQLNKPRFDGTIRGSYFNQITESLTGKKRKKRFTYLMNLFREDGSTIDIPEFEHRGILLERKEESKILFRSIEKLSEDQKTAYILKNIRGLSYKKISEIMKKTSSSIESLIFRAKKNLKVMIENELNDKK